MSTEERIRRLVPYVTYYVVGNNDNDVQYQYQNPKPNPPRPHVDNFYYQSERKPQQKQPVQYQHNYEIPIQQHQQTSSDYLRFPSPSKFRRPIVIATSEMPYIEQTEKTYNNNYDYSQTSPSPRPILKPNPIKYEYEFLPTIPPTPSPYSPPEQDFYSTKPKKLKPKSKRPTTPVITTTTDKYEALNELLNGYDLGNRLSNKITAENIGSSIQTLSAVLQILQNEADEQVRPKKKPKPEYRPDPIDDYDTSDVGNPGRPGIDYPTLSVIPKTSFDCKTQRYKGFFGDPETKCQVWNIIF